MQPHAPTSQVELLPCPFCGGERGQLTMQKTLRDGYRDYQDDQDAWAYRVTCYSCATEGPWYKTEGNAHRGWNTRPSQFARITYLVVHAEGCTIYGVYPYPEEGKAILMAEALWADADHAIDAVRVFKFKEGISHREDYLEPVEMPTTDEEEAP